MKYRSTHLDLPLEFELGGVDYVVPPGSFVEIPDRWHPWVLSRGLYLKVVEEIPEPTPEEPKKNADRARKGKV